MNTSSTLHDSFWGRTWLLTKIGFFSTLRQALLFYGTIALLFIGMPFLFNLFVLGNPIEAFGEVTEGYRYGGMSSIFITTTFLYLLGFLHRLVHQPSPGVYTQLPTSAGEKLASIALLMLGYLALSIVISTLLTFLFTLGTGAYLGGEWAVLFGLIGEIPGRWIGAAFLSSLFPFLVVAFTMIQFKKPIVGILVAMLFFFVLTNLTYSTLVHLEDYESVARYLQKLGEATAAYFLTGFFLVLDAATVWLIHWRLKTLQLK